MASGKRQALSFNGLPFTDARATYDFNNRFIELTTPSLTMVPTWIHFNSNSE